MNVHINPRVALCMHVQVGGHAAPGLMGGLWETDDLRF